MKNLSRNYDLIWRCFSPCYVGIHVPSNTNNDWSFSCYSFRDLHSFHHLSFTYHLLFLRTSSWWFLVELIELRSFSCKIILSFYRHFSDIFITKHNNENLSIFGFPNSFSIINRKSWDLFDVWIICRIIGVTTLFVKSSSHVSLRLRLHTEFT